MEIRNATPVDHEAIWNILEPVIRAGETYAIPPDWTREEALGYWFTPGHEVFVACLEGVVVGTYYLKANGKGGGSHVSNCGYMTSGRCTGRGVASAMCEHSLERARARGFRAMQFNFVIASNEGAVRLWHKHGFATVGRMPGVFLHPHLGFVDALVMHREL